MYFRPSRPLLRVNTDTVTVSMAPLIIRIHIFSNFCNFQKTACNSQKIYRRISLHFGMCISQATNDINFEWKFVCFKGSLDFRKRPHFLLHFFFSKRSKLCAMCFQFAKELWNKDCKNTLKLVVGLFFPGDFLSPREWGIQGKKKFPKGSLREKLFVF